MTWLRSVLALAFLACGECGLGGGSVYYQVPSTFDSFEWDGFVCTLDVRGIRVLEDDLVAFLCCLVKTEEVVCHVVALVDCEVEGLVLYLAVDLALGGQRDGAAICDGDVGVNGGIVGSGQCGLAEVLGCT